MLDAARGHRHAVVIGGGLLGLEAANGLLRAGHDVTVVHVMDSLMERQLDGAASTCCNARSKRTGMRFLLPAKTRRRSSGDGSRDGRALRGRHARFPPISSSWRPACGRTSSSRKRPGCIASAAIVVDDTLQTYDPRVYAVGECVQHRNGDLRPRRADLGAGARLRDASRRARASPLLRRADRDEAQGDGHRSVFGRRLHRRAGQRRPRAARSAPRHLQAPGASRTTA